MKLIGESLIAADRATVWATLSDPAVRARCAGAVATPAAEGEPGARIAALPAPFTGGVTMTEAHAPDHCVLVSADEHGSAAITLDDAAVGDAGGTRLSYVVTAAADGDAPARMAAFVAQLKTEAERARSPADAPPTVRTAIHHDVTDAAQLHGNRVASGLTPLLWGGILVLAVLAVLVWQLSA